MQVQQWAKRLMNNDYASRFALEAVPEVLRKIAEAINGGQLGEPVPRPANLPSHMPGRSATHNMARNNGGRGSAARQHRCPPLTRLCCTYHPYILEHALPLI